MSPTPGGEGRKEAAGLQKLVDPASRELQKRAVAQNLLAESSGVREQAHALRRSGGDAPAGPSQAELDRFSFLRDGPEPERTVHELPARTRQDLQLAEVVRAMAVHGSVERYLTALLGAQLGTVDQIRHRQSVLQPILVDVDPANWNGAPSAAVLIRGASSKKPPVIPQAAKLAGGPLRSAEEGLGTRSGTRVSWSRKELVRIR